MLHYLSLEQACRVDHEYITFLSSSAVCSRLCSSMTYVHGVAYFCVKITIIIIIIIYGQKIRATVCTRNNSAASQTHVHGK